ncbi:MAG: HAD hydrolase family protein [Deltaproteobacteria bacterium]|nr:HAD hydrolase family protein [Deltaproteobacteria bacterium]
MCANKVEFKEKLKNVKLLLLDVDGVLTDGSIVYNDKGVETKSFNVRDGHGIKLIQRAGIECGIITARISEVVRFRADELGIAHVFQGAKVKLDTYGELLSKTGLKDEDICYIGDDLVDMPVLSKVGFSVGVSDAVPEVLEAVDYVTEKCGGRGAVRELIEMILKAQDKWKDVTKQYFKS